MIRALSFSASLIFAVTAFITTGCAQTPAPSAQYISEPRSGGGIAALYAQRRLPYGLHDVDSATPANDKSADESWGAFAMVEPEQVKATIRGRHVAYLGFGMANHHETRQAAEDAALQMCQADGLEGCAVRYVFQNQSMAFYFSPLNLAYGWAIAATPNRATARATTICEQYSRTGACQLFYNSFPSK